MSKTIKNSFDEKLNFINLYNAYHRICKCNRNKKYLLKADMDIETIICNLGNELKNNKYTPGVYRVFTIYEPKERVIKTLPFRDRIVHRWYIEEFIKPFFVPRFINDTFACIEKRGTHKAVKVLQKYMRIMKRNKGSFYVLKCDIKKFFYNIDKEILEKVKVFLEEKLKLQLNNKTTYFPYYCGVNFCDYKIFTTHILVKGSSKRKIKKKINIWNKKQYNFKQIESSYNSYLGHVKHCCSYNFVKSLESSIEQIRKRGSNSE